MIDIEKRIAYAEKKLDEAISNGNDCDVLYWRGYLDALVRIYNDTLNEVEK